MKTNFDTFVKAIRDFEIKAGFEKTPKYKLVAWLKKEIRHYNAAKTSTLKRGKLIDIIILTLQLARRDKVSLDVAWNEWFKTSQKYIKQK